MGAREIAGRGENACTHVLDETLHAGDCPREGEVRAGAEISANSARGAALLKKNDYAGALADLDKATSLDQANAESYYVRARVYEAQGKSELAIADLRKASEFPPKSVFESLAQANAKKRIQELTKAIPCSAPGEGGSCL